MIGRNGKLYVNCQDIERWEKEPNREIITIYISCH